MNIFVHFLWTCVFNSLSIYLEVELLGHMVTLLSILRNCFSKWQVAASFYIAVIYEGSNFSTSFLNIGFLRVCKVVSDFYFLFAFLLWQT